MTGGMHPSFDEPSAPVRGVGRLPGAKLLHSLSLGNKLNPGFGVLVALTLLVVAPSFFSPQKIQPLSDAVLSDTQHTHLDNIVLAREALLRPPLQVFEVVDRERAGEDLYRFRTQAMPQAARVLRVLGEMTPEQQALLQPELDTGGQKLVSAQGQTLVGGVLAFMLGVGVALLFRGKMFGPNRGSTDATRYLEELVEERTAKLEEANRQLTQEIAERVRAESHRDAIMEALRESEERYRVVSELTSDYADALRVEPDGSLTREWVTEAFTRITGFTPDELPAHDGWKRIVHPDDFPIFHRRLEALLSGQPDVSKYRIITKSGEVRWLRAHGRPIWDESGSRILRYVGAARDITERVQAEEQVERYATQLEQSNEELRQFTYIVSHDLRAPLVNLKGFAAELRSTMEVIGPAIKTALPHLGEGQGQAVSTALKDDIPEALGFIESSVTRMDGFINALLGLSRLGRRQLDLEPIDMQVLARATLETLTHQIEERGVKVSVGSLPEVVADRTSMEQIMGNLLDNAVKYLDPARPGFIEISAERDHTETTFQVRDNGRGIDEADLDKIFAPFRRAGRQDVPGEGMGLPYVQALVRRHGGRIWCESELGVGTTFVFTIPDHLK